MMLLKFDATSFAVFSLAKTPAGIEIIIDKEKPNAIITSNALIFLLEIFLIALLTTPMLNPFN